MVTMRKRRGDEVVFSGLDFLEQPVTVDASIYLAHFAWL